MTPFPQTPTTPLPRTHRHRYHQTILIVAFYAVSYQVNIAELLIDSLPPIRGAASRGARGRGRRLNGSGQAGPPTHSGNPVS